MEKKVKILPSINNLDWAGRVVADPYISGKTCRFDVIRNFGGGKQPVTITFTLFKPSNGDFPAVIKKGEPVVVHAYITPNSYTNKKGEEKTEIQYVVKSIERAELIEKTIHVDKDEDAGEGVVEVE